MFNVLRHLWDKWQYINEKINVRARIKDWLTFCMVKGRFLARSNQNKHEKKSTRNASRNNKRVSTTQQIDCLCDKVIVTIVPSFCRSFALCTVYNSLYTHIVCLSSSVFFKYSFFLVNTFCLCYSFKNLLLWFFLHLIKLLSKHLFEEAVPWYIDLISLSFNTTNKQNVKSEEQKKRKKNNTGRLTGERERITWRIKWIDGNKSSFT